MDKRREVLQTGERLKRTMQGILSVFLCVAMALSFTFFVLPEKKVNAETTDDIAKQVRVTVENKRDKVNQKVNPDQWGDDVYIFWWYKNGTEAKGPEWPGVKMKMIGTTPEGHRVYQYNIVPEGVLGGILLDDGTGESGIHQTVDIPISPEGDYTGILAWLKYGTTEANITNSGLYVIYHPFTYDDSIKLPSTVKTEPTALTLTENGAAQALVNAGQTEDGTLYYALGKDASVAPTDGWSNEIPTGKDAGTYYVWYKVTGDGSHRDSEAKCVTVTISAKTITATSEDKGNTDSDTTSEVVDQKQKATSVSKVKAGKKCITVTWKKQTKGGIAGYEIQYSPDSKFEKDVKTVTISKAKTASKKIKKLKSKKKYYVRIRTFKKSKDGKVYSKWSKTKSVKVK